MDDLIDVARTVGALNEILKAEFSGVVHYTHYSLVITGPNRLPLVTFMQGQATESLLHAQQAGEIFTGLGGHPEQGIAPIAQSHDYDHGRDLSFLVGYRSRRVGCALPDLPVG